MSSLLPSPLLSSPLLSSPLLSSPLLSSPLLSSPLLSSPLLASPHFTSNFSLQPDQDVCIRPSKDDDRLLTSTIFINPKKESSALTHSLPHSDCRVCVIVPVHNEAENLPGVIRALAGQVDAQGNPLNPNSYEVLLLANNCSDRTVDVAHQLGQRYPSLRLHIIEITLSKADAYVGKARQMVMDEAYRRLSLIGMRMGTQNRIIASTDGDTEVAADWIAALIAEFDLGVDAVGGRIITRRNAEPDISKQMSLCYLRSLAHAFLAVQIECCLDPQHHDGWPRHSQYYGANMSITAEVYKTIGGMPLVKDGEDVALYEQLQQADAKIRHSVAAKVFTSARQVGRATGGLAEHLEQLSVDTQKKKPVLVESPQITEARILLRKQLKYVWQVLHTGDRFTIRQYARTADLLAKYLGLSSAQLTQKIETAPTFGRLIAAVIDQQKQCMDPLPPTVEVQLANLQLRNRLSAIQQQSRCFPTALSGKGKSVFGHGEDPQVVLKTFQQIKAIPLFPSAR